MQSLSQLEPTSVIGRLKIITILKDISTVSSTSRISQLYLQLQESLNCIFNFKNLSTVSSTSRISQLYLQLQESLNCILSISSSLSDNCGPNPVLCIQWSFSLESPPPPLRSSILSLPLSSSLFRLK